MAFMSAAILTPSEAVLSALYLAVTAFVGELKSRWATAELEAEVDRRVIGVDSLVVYSELCDLRGWLDSSLDEPSLFQQSLELTGRGLDGRSFLTLFPWEWPEQPLCSFLSGLGESWPLSEVSNWPLKEFSNSPNTTGILNDDTLHLFDIPPWTKVGALKWCLAAAAASSSGGRAPHCSAVLQVWGRFTCVWWLL